MTPLATLSLAEYRRRKAAFDDAVNARGYPREQAEKTLACWLSLALAAGVKPADCGAVVEYWQKERGLSDSWARHILLWQGPSEAECHAELARARDQAAAKARANPTDRQAQQRHLTLDNLAIYLGLAPEAPAPEQRKAA